MSLKCSAGFIGLRNSPNTLLPEPDIAAYTAPRSYSRSFIRPISGCNVNTLCSKSLTSVSRHVSTGCITISRQFASGCCGVTSEKASLVGTGMSGRTTTMCHPPRSRSMGCSCSPMPSAYAGLPSMKTGSRHQARRRGLSFPPVTYRA